MQQCPSFSLHSRMCRLAGRASVDLEGAELKGRRDMSVKNPLLASELPRGVLVRYLHEGSSWTIGGAMLWPRKKGMQEGMHAGIQKRDGDLNVGVTEPLRRVP